MKQQKVTNDTESNVIIYENNQPLIQDQNKKQKRNPFLFVHLIKIINILLALGIIGFGVYYYLKIKQSTGSIIDFKDPSKLILPGYVSLYGLLILFVQTDSSIIKRNMNFLYNYFGRGIFNIYVGILCLTIIRQQLEQRYTIMIYIIAGALCLLGLGYIIARLCCCVKPSKNKKKKNRRSQDID